jgi:hypothetical protein
MAGRKVHQNLILLMTVPVVPIVLGNDKQSSSPIDPAAPYQWISQYRFQSNNNMRILQAAIKAHSNALPYPRRAFSSALEELIKEDIKLRRLEFAVGRIDLELQDGRLGSPWKYDNRNPRLIRDILYCFRMNCGRSIPNEVATQEYRDALQNEIHRLVGVKPRLKLQDREGNKQWCIWYD